MTSRRNEIFERERRRAEGGQRAADVEEILRTEQRTAFVTHDGERSPLVSGWSQTFNLNPVYPTILTQAIPSGDAPAIAVPGSAGIPALGPSGLAVTPYFSQTNLGLSSGQIGAPWRVCDFTSEMQGCVAVTIQNINEYIFPNVSLTFIVQRRSATLQRTKVMIPWWGMAFPLGAGHVLVDINVQFPNGKDPPPAINQTMTVTVAYSIGVPVSERYPIIPEGEIDLAGSLVLTPVDFARTMEITNMSAASVTISAGTVPAAMTLGPNESVVLPAQVRTIHGAAGASIAVVWEVLGP